MDKGFKIIGVSVRTSNQNNQAATDLPKLWQQFFEAEVLENTPNKISNDVLSIYTDYESDFTGAYTTIIGVMVDTLDEVPQGLLGREFGPDKFDVFTAAGEMPMAVVNTWNEIWQKDKDLNRKYNYDFEVYGAESQQGANSKVAIYISVK